MKQLRSIDHEIYMWHLNKVSISPLDTKKWLCPDGISTLAYGHYKIATAFDLDGSEPEPEPEELDAAIELFAEEIVREVVKEIALNLLIDFELEDLESVIEESVEGLQQKNSVCEASTVVTEPEIEKSIEGLQQKNSVEPEQTYCVFNDEKDCWINPDFPIEEYKKYKPFSREYDYDYEESMKWRYL